MGKNKRKPSARAAAAFVVSKVLEEGAYTNIAVNRFLSNTSLEDRERRLFTELVYNTVKASGVIDWLLSLCSSRPLAKIDKEILCILRISICQVLFLERIPEAAACNEAVNLARKVKGIGSAQFVNGVLRSLLRKLAAGEISFPEREKDLASYFAWKYYHPRWLVKRWLGSWGETGTEKLLAFNNAAAPVCLRVNTLQTKREKLIAALTAVGSVVRASKWSPDGVIADKLPSLNKLFLSLDRDFYIQDESSMLVAPLLNVSYGMNVLDLCSAPGGKATHIAQLMGNSGSITACDIFSHKLALIEANAHRLGINNIKTVLNDATILRNEWIDLFDRVLVDAPCSGMGVLRRRAEARWRKKKQDLKVFPPLQLAILSNAAQYVKNGGRLVYSTCTIEQSENHYVVEEFLRRYPAWQRVSFRHPLKDEIISELQVLPQEDGIDGFYICPLERK